MSSSKTYALSITIVALVISSGIAVVSYYNSQSQVADYQGRIQQLNNLVGVTQTQMSDVVIELNITETALSLKTTQLNTELQTSNTNTVTLNSQIGSLQNQVGVLESQVSIVSGNVTTIQGKVANLNQQISTMQSTNSQLLQQIQSLNSQVSSFQTQLSLMQIQLNSMQSQITRLTAIINVQVNQTILNNAEVINDGTNGNVFIYNVNFGSILYAGYIYVSFHSVFGRFTFSITEFNLNYTTSPGYSAVYQFPMYSAALASVSFSPTDRDPFGNAVGNLFVTIVYWY